MDIQPIVGANLSVQISASDPLAYPGQEITLRGRGASIFVWNSDDGSVVDVPGPQLIVYPTAKTTYIATGSGFELCNTSAETTIYIADDVLSVEDDPVFGGISLYPNPGDNILKVELDNLHKGAVSISLCNPLGTRIIDSHSLFKTEQIHSSEFNTSVLAPGLYILKLNLGGKTVVKKWIKK
jgi:hypothetical protein